MNAVETDHIFARVASILEQARGEVVHSVNQATVVAYWSIGREIVEALQGGDARASYGKALVGNLSERLTARFGKGFSVPNLKFFRQFYTAYAERIGDSQNNGRKSEEGGRIMRKEREVEEEWKMRSRPMCRRY